MYLSWKTKPKKNQKPFQGLPGHINPSQQNMKRGMLTLTGVAIENMKTWHFMMKVSDFWGFVLLQFQEWLRHQSIKGSDTIPTSWLPLQLSLGVVRTQCNHLGLTPYNKLFSFYGYKYLSHTYGSCKEAKYEHFQYKYSVLAIVLYLIKEGF